MNLINTYSWKENLPTDFILNWKNNEELEWYWRRYLRCKESLGRNEGKFIPLLDFEEYIFVLRQDWLTSLLSLQVPTSLHHTQKST